MIWVIVGIVGFILICIIAWIAMSNGIKVAGLKCDEALSGIDVALTKRYDVLTKMLDVVKAFQRHERETLTELVQLRSGMSMAERQAANGRMDLLSGQIRILAENYPELRSSQNFGELQRTIADVEEHLMAFEGFIFESGEKLIVFSDGSRILFSSLDDSKINDDSRTNELYQMIAAEVTVMEN